MNFNDIFSPEILAYQREFIRTFQANLDFKWWAESLVVEETKEVQEAYNNGDMDNLFKELADLLYVIAGFYNTIPRYPNEVVSKEDNEKIEKILNDALEIFFKVVSEKEIPISLIGKAFMLVHRSNMSKICPHTNTVLRREDGKILKGENYQPPSMLEIVEEWKSTLQQKD